MRNRSRHVDYLVIKIALATFLSQFYFAFAGDMQWTEPLSLTGQRTLAENPNSAYSPRDGKLFVVWDERNTFDISFHAQLFMVVYDTKTEVISPVTAITDTGRKDLTPDVAIDTNGYPHIVWSDDISHEIYYMYQTGTGWSMPANISKDGGPGYYPRIQIDKENNIHVVWHDAASGYWRIYYSGFDGLQWSVPMIVSDSLRDGGYPRLAIDSQNNLHCVWHSQPNPWSSTWNIWYRTRANGTWSSLESVTTDTIESYYPDIAIDKEDLAVVVWEHVVQSGLLPVVERIYWSRKSSDGHWSTPESISDSSRSMHPSIVIDTWDQFHVSSEKYHVNGSIARDSIYYTSYNQGRWDVMRVLSSNVPYPLSTTPHNMINPSGELFVTWLCMDNTSPNYYSEIYLTRTTIVGSAMSKSGIPAEASLDQNYPNPFNPSTTIHFELPKQSHVRLEIFSVLAQPVMQIIDEKRQAGAYDVPIKAGNLSSGVYFYRLTAGDFVQTKKMVLMK